MAPRGRAGAGRARRPEMQYGGGYDEHDYGRAGADPAGATVRRGRARALRSTSGGSAGPTGDTRDDPGRRLGRRKPLRLAGSGGRDRRNAPPGPPRRARDRPRQRPAQRLLPWLRPAETTTSGTARRKKRRRSRAGMVALCVLIVFLGGIIGGGAVRLPLVLQAARRLDRIGLRLGPRTGRAERGRMQLDLENTLVSDGVVASASAFCDAAKAARQLLGTRARLLQAAQAHGRGAAWALIINPKSRVQTRWPSRTACGLARSSRCWPPRPAFR